MKASMDVMVVEVVIYSELRGSDPQEPIVYTYSRLCLEPIEYLAR